MMRKLLLLLILFAGTSFAQPTDFLSGEVLDHVLRNESYTPPTTIFVSLHTADPTDACTSEVSGGSYARQSSTFDAAASSATQNSALIEYLDMPAVTVTHVAIWDAVSAGNCLVRGALTASQAVDAGQTFQIATGDLDVTLQ